MKFRFAFLVFGFVLLTMFACKRKKHVAAEMPVAVKTFQAPDYQKSAVDSLTLVNIENFGSEYDSTAYVADIDSIAKYVLGQKWEETFSTPTGVVYYIEKFGNGEFARKGDRMHVHTETITLSGKKFFSTYDLKQPLDFVLGVGQVMPAWDEVLQNFPEGTKATIISPSALAYGKKGIKKVLAPNLILVCKIEVKKVIPDKLNPSPASPSFQYSPKDTDQKSDDNIPFSLKKL